MAKEVVHVNLMNSDNEVYCRKRNKVVVFDEGHQRDYCADCPFWRGSAQGDGVECEWEDVRDIPSVYVVKQPQVEKNHIITAEAKAKK